MIRRRTLLAAASLSALPAAAQEAWPSRPIRFILPYPPGGAADRLARALADHLRDRLSTTTGWPSRSRRWSARARASRSAAPPGG